ncbi:MAG: response regulator [Deltaproteobacteria bacterium]|nr:response regulator [Deltaproteobacteria bacterium]
MKDREKRLSGKRILIVDDEPDILGSLEDLLDMCEIDRAADYEAAVDLLDRNSYDAAILDIMGVRGYDLLEVTSGKGIPTIMLTAHALSSGDFVKSVETGAQAYVPKDRIAEIATFLSDVLDAAEGRSGKKQRWFDRLEAFFEKKFGPDWREKEDPEFWKKYFYM